MAERDIPAEYHRQLRGSDGEVWLRRRGFSNKILKEASIGFIQEALTEDDDRYVGWITIPFYDLRERLVTIRYRRIDDGKPKYHQRKNVPVPPYGVSQAITARPYITEGEFDALTLRMLGYPAVGLPGARMWDRNGRVWRWLFRDCEMVSIIMDPDQDGQDASATIAQDLTAIMIPSREIILPAGMDVNDLYIKNPEELLEIING